MLKYNLKKGFTPHFLGDKLLPLIVKVQLKKGSPSHFLGNKLLPLSCVVQTLGCSGVCGGCRMCWFSFLSQKLKAVTITMEAAAIPALKWKAPTSVNAPGDLFWQKTTTLARVGQQNLPGSPCPPRECLKELFFLFLLSSLSLSFPAGLMELCY